MSSNAPHARIITPPGEGGIGIIVLSGPGAAELLDRVFAGTRRRAAQLRPGSIAHGTIRWDGAVLDEVIVARAPPPQPAAEQPCFEVNCHGGVAAVRAVLDCLHRAGAEVAGWEDQLPSAPPSREPLSAAAIRSAALARLAQAPTRLGAVMLLHQAEGALRAALEQIGVTLEAGEANRAARCVDALLASAVLGGALLGPPRVALIGPPNVGKSTLLNALLEEERVIVHHEPGTTRDVVVERVSLRGVPFDIMDAAGIRPTEDGVEKEAVGRALRLAGSCNVALLIFDAREGTWGEDAPQPAFQPGTRMIPVGNKLDLLAGLPPKARLPVAGDAPTVYLSAREKTNLDLLESALLEPYALLIEPCRCGGAVVFDASVGQALACARDALRRDGAEGALGALRRAGL